MLANADLGGGMQDHWSRKAKEGRRSMTLHLLLGTPCTFSSDHLRSSLTLSTAAGEASIPCSFPKGFTFPLAPNWAQRGLA